MNVDFKSKGDAEKHRYRVFAGSPNGTAYNSLRCAAEVHDGGRAGLFNQCGRKPGYGPDHIYCAQHAKKHAASHS